jgi:hypothetical protein
MYFPIIIIWFIDSIVRLAALVAQPGRALPW